MANRRSGFAKKIDTVHWTYGSFLSVALGAGTSAVNLFSAQHLPETLLRMRGEWACSFAPALADGAGVAMTVGIIQVPEGTDTTVLWSPVTDGDAPWIWWDVFHLLYREHVTDVNYSAMTSSARRVIDSKAMRKLRNTELQCVFENTTLTGLTAASVDTAGSVRALTGN